MKQNKIIAISDPDGIGRDNLEKIRDRLKKGRPLWLSDREFNSLQKSKGLTAVFNIMVDRMKKEVGL